MTDLSAALRRISDDLAELKRGFAVVGGVAISARAEPRFTRDIDLVVAVADDREAETVVFGLQQKGYAVVASVEQERARALAALQLIQERGYARNKDLVREWTDLVQSVP